MSGFYVVDEQADGKPVYRRRTAPPIGGLVDGQPSEPAAGPFDPLGAPDPFPLAWLEEPPDWLGRNEGVRVVLGGADVGRAAGYVRLHGSCYQDGTSSCRVPPPVSYETFYRGQAEVIDRDGARREVAVGAICVVGGHSMSASGGNAGSHTEAIEFMDRPEKWKLRGVLVEDHIGLLFLGAARPDMTRAEAVMVNQSDTSGEWWPIYEQDAHGVPTLVGHDLIGIALVAGGAFRKPAAERFRVLAAALGRDLTDVELEAIGMACSCGGSCCGGGGGVLAAVGPSAGQIEQQMTQAMTPVEPSGVPSGDPSPQPAAPAAVPVQAPDPAPVQAAQVDVQIVEQITGLGALVSSLQATVGSLEETVDAMRVEMDRMQRDVIRLTVQSLTEEEITLPEQVSEQADVLQAMDLRMARIEADLSAQRGAAVTVAPPEPAAAAVPAAAPVMAGR